MKAAAGRVVSGNKGLPLPATVGVASVPQSLLDFDSVSSDHQVLQPIITSKRALSYSLSQTRRIFGRLCRVCRRGHFRERFAC